MADDDRYPNSFFCPITTAIMRDPVVDREGNSYEREAIERWLQRKHTSPVTRRPLNTGDLIPNRALKDAIETAVRGRAAEGMAQSGPPQIDLVGGSMAVGGLLATGVASGLKFAKQKTQEAAAFVDDQRAESSCRRLEREHAAQFSAERRAGGGGGAQPHSVAEPGGGAVSGAVGGAVQDALFVAGRAGSSVVERISAAGDAAMSEALPREDAQRRPQVHLPFGDEQEDDDGEWRRPPSQAVPLPAAAATPGEVAPARECIASSRCGFGCATIAEHMANMRSSGGDGGATAGAAGGGLAGSAQQPLQLGASDMSAAPSTASGSANAVPVPAVRGDGSTQELAPRLESGSLAGDTAVALSLRCAWPLMLHTHSTLPLRREHFDFFGAKLTWCGAVRLDG